MYTCSEYAHSPGFWICVFLGVCLWNSYSSSQIPNIIQFSLDIYPSQQIFYASVPIWKREAEGWFHFPGQELVYEPRPDSIRVHQCPEERLAQKSAHDQKYGKVLEEEISLLISELLVHGISGRNQEWSRPFCFHERCSRRSKPTHREDHLRDLQPQRRDA